MNSKKKGKEMKLKKNRKKSMVLLLFILIMVVSLSGCDKKSLNGAEKQPELDRAATITDREGNKLELPKQTSKIVSMAPSITQTLVSLGLGDSLAAVDSYSKDIEGVNKGAIVFDMMNPDIEQLAALKPDIIFATGMSKSDGDDPFKSITDLGIKMTYIPSSVSIEGIKEDIRFLGKVTNTEKKAETIIEDMEKEINDILFKIEQQGTKKKVYFEIAAAPDIYSFGEDTFLTEIINLLGGENILKEKKGWIPVSEETIIAANPDIIFTNVNYIEDPVGEIKGRKGWDIINGVKESRVYQIDNNSSSQPNENIVLAFKQMAQGMYPELFHE